MLASSYVENSLVEGGVMFSPKIAQPAQGGGGGGAMNPNPSSSSFFQIFCVMLTLRVAQQRGVQ
jgi:hypothetical protein